jgi:NAD(P)-dependent dehydrogenase (short-subunit alcohol dehydrogenase family)
MQQKEEVERLIRYAIPVVILAGAVELNGEWVKEHEWAAVMRRPFTIGAVADKVERLLAPRKRKEIMESLAEKGLSAMNLRDKRIMIIGGSSGIGFATARAAVAAEAAVVIVGRSLERLEKAKDEIGASGKVEVQTLDVRDEAAVQTFFERIGAFDHLTTPGSEVSGGSFLTGETAVARANMESKFWGQYHAAKYGTPNLRPGGSIVLFSGTYSQRPPAGAGSIAAINGAIEALGRALAIELSPLRVNVVSPGLVDTPVYSYISESERIAMFQSVSRSLPARRIGRPEDIAQTVIYLMTNPFTTGSTIFVDGGHALR